MLSTGPIGSRNDSLCMQSSGLFRGTNSISFSETRIRPDRLVHCQCSAMILFLAKGFVMINRPTISSRSQVITLLWIHRIELRYPMDLSFINRFCIAFIDHLEDKVLDSMLSHGSIKRSLRIFLQPFFEVLRLSLRRFIRLADVNFTVDLVRDLVDELHSYTYLDHWQITGQSGLRGSNPRL